MDNFTDNSPSDGLAAFLEIIRADIINSMQAHGKDTGGQTAKQLVITTDGDTATLELPAYMQLLETGRGPTGKDAVAGNPPMIARIQQWCREKGIPDKAAWAIKKSIDKKGFKGVPGLLSDPLGDKNINLRLDAVTEDMAAGYSEWVRSGL